MNPLETQLNIDPDFFHDLKSGEPAPPSIDEDTARLLYLSWRALSFMWKGASSPDDLRTMDIPRILRALQARCENERATFVAYEDMVQNLFKEMESPAGTLMHAAIGIAGEGGEILDACKKHWVYNKPIDATNLLEELGDCYFYMQKIMLMFGWTIDTVKLANRQKLAKRYPDGVYSDKDAQARADKIDVVINPAG